MSDKPILTTRQGHPVHNNQQQRTVASRIHGLGEGWLIGGPDVKEVPSYLE